MVVVDCRGFGLGFRVLGGGLELLQVAVAFFGVRRALHVPTNGRELLMLWCARGLSPVRLPLYNIAPWRGHFGIRVEELGFRPKYTLAKVQAQRYPS